MDEIGEIRHNKNEIWCIYPMYEILIYFLFTNLFISLLKGFGTFYNKIFNKIEKVVGKPLTAKVPIFQKEAKNSPEIITKKIEDFVNGMFPIENSANAAATETYAEGSP